MLAGSQPLAPDTAAPCRQSVARTVRSKRAGLEPGPRSAPRSRRPRAIRSIDAEWLVDNFYIIEDSLREVRRDLRPGYDEQLPKLAALPLGGYPRVYALALALVAHTDSELDETRGSCGSSAAFQEFAPLEIGELWACPPCFGWSSWKTFDGWLRRWSGNGMNSSGLIDGQTPRWPAPGNPAPTEPPATEHTAASW